MYGWLPSIPRRWLLYSAERLKDADSKMFSRARRLLDSASEAMTRSERRFRVTLAAVGVFASALRLAHVASLARVLGTRQILDAAFYHDEARYLAGASTVPVEPGATRFANPGYSEILAALYRVFGASEQVGLTAQALCGGLTAFVLGLTTSKLLNDRRAGLCAASIWACYAPSIQYDGVLLTPSFTALFTALALAALVLLLGTARHAAKRPSYALYGPALAAGVCVGFATWLRPSNVLLGVGFAAVLGLWSRKGQRELGRAALFLAAGAALVIAPGVLSQHERSGDWLPLSANGGMNLWVGNNRTATGAYTSANFVGSYQATGHEYTVVVERNAYLEEARRRTQDVDLGVADASAFWRGLAFDEILSDPPRWLGLELEKLTLFCNRFESHTNVSTEFLARFSNILRFDPLGFGALMLLGGYGFLLLYGSREASERRAALLLLTAIGAPLLGCLIFFVSGEYRHVASCALTIAAAHALARWSRGIARLPWTTRGDKVRSLGWAALGLLVLYPVDRPGDTGNATAYASWLATVHADGEKPTREAYDRAERILYTSDDAALSGVLRDEALLVVYMNRAIEFGDLHAAQLLTDTAVRLWQRDPEPRNGVPEPIARRVHRLLFERVRQLAAVPFVNGDPQLSRRLALLGGHDYAEIAQSARAGSLSEARALAAEAVELTSASVEALTEQGSVELFAGQPEAGRAILERAVDTWPEQARPAVILCQQALQAADGRRAAKYFEIANDREPTNRDVQQLRRALRSN